MIDFKLTQGVAYFVGKNIETERHSHHALEFILGIDEPFDLISEAGELRDIQGVIINPNFPHQFVGSDAKYLFVFLEPELIQTQQIKDHFDLEVLETVQVDCLSEFPDSEKVIDFSFFEEELGIPMVHSSIAKIDDRIREVVAFIKGNLEQGQVSSVSLAEKVYLSESRFLHLFKEQIGIPVRRFVLWCRIQEALKELLTGSNFTRSAHAAGFSDSAHFSRTFSEMFGVSPSSVLKR